MLRLLFFILMFSLTGVCNAQDSIPYLRLQDVGTNKIMTHMRFNEQQLQAYLGEDANYYIEYGLVEMLLQEIIYKQFVIRVEYYMMKDPAAAFGAYSAMRQKCARSFVLTKYDCLSMKQCSFAMGRLYVNISTKESSLDAGTYCETLGRAIINRLRFKDFEFSHYFDCPLFYGNLVSARLVKGNIGMARAYPEWLERFKGLSYEAVMVPVDFKGGSCNVAQISFRTIIDMERFIKMNKLEANGIALPYKKTEGKTRQYLVNSGVKEVIYMETWGDSAEADDYSYKIEQWTKNYLKSAKQN